MTIKLIHNGRPIPIYCSTEYTAMAFVDKCGAPAYPNLDDIVLKIRRAGFCVHEVQYCPSDYDKVQNLLFFTWDSFLYDLPPGRYIADLYDNCVHVGHQQIDLHPSEYKTATPVKVLNQGYDWGCEEDLGCFDVSVVSDFGDESSCTDCVEIEDKSLTKGDHGCVTVTDGTECG